jgi:hypothetical protein
MRPLMSVAVAFACASACLQSHAEGFGPYDITFQADVRAVFANTPYEGSAYGGLGVTRFDEQHDGLRLGRLMLDISGPLTETLRGVATFSATNDGDAHAIDVTEAYVEWRPYPHGPIRWRTRAGAFYAPISLENRAIGWESLYTLSPSAINSWIGEETRSIGVESSATLVGAPAGRHFDVSLIAGVYGWNDPMGVLMLQRGWAITNRQTTLFGGLPRPLSTSAHDARIEFFREIDDRPGVYYGGEWKNDEHVVRLLRYDNRGDPSVSAGKDSAWRTRFNSLGWRWELPTHTTLIVQALDGDTGVGDSDDGRGFLIMNYWSYFGLASQTFGAHRVSLRYDRMYTDMERGAEFYPGEQSAHAWTAAYLWDVAARWQLAAEAIRISGSLQQRAFIGQPTSATEENFQLAVRYTW